jgi:hypothetical protein
MQVPLPVPVPVTETITQTTTRESVEIEFCYADFLAGSVKIKLQPWNIEVAIAGEQYESMRQQFEAALAGAFAPAIEAALAPYMPQPEPAE